MDIHQEWENGRLPIINGILYENGVIDWINISYDSNFNRSISGVRRRSIDDLISSRELFFSIINTSYQMNDKGNNIRVYCGGGSCGSEGYVVVESNIDLKLLWIAFFEESNPFEKIEIIGDRIIVYNNLKEKWTFEINNPVNLSIT